MDVRVDERVSVGGDDGCGWGDPAGVSVSGDYSVVVSSWVNRYLQPTTPGGDQAPRSSRRQRGSISTHPPQVCAGFLSPSHTTTPVVQQPPISGPHRRNYSRPLTPVVGLPVLTLRPGLSICPIPAVGAILNNGLYPSPAVNAVSNNSLYPSPVHVLCLTTAPTQYQLHSLCLTTYPSRHQLHALCLAKASIRHQLHALCLTTALTQYQLHSLCLTTYPSRYQLHVLCLTKASIRHQLHTVLNNNLYPSPAARTVLNKGLYPSPAAHGA